MQETRIRDVRHRLLALHKHLLDVEREERERIGGRIAPADFLRLVIEDPAFAWLRPMTELIVRVDEWLDDDERSAEAGEIWLREVRHLLAPEPALHDFHLRYSAFLQTRPEIVIAHAGVTRAARETRDEDPQETP